MSVAGCNLLSSLEWLSTFLRFRYYDNVTFIFVITVSILVQLMRHQVLESGFKWAAYVCRARVSDLSKSLWVGCIEVEPVELEVALQLKEV